MVLSKNGTHLLLAGTVVTSSATGYAYGFVTDEDKATVPTESPENAPAAPVSAPVSKPTTQSDAPSIQDSETVSSAVSVIALSTFSRVLIACVLILIL